MISTFGKRLKNKRLERGLTQEYLAKKINVRRSAISQWENDETQPKGKNLLALAKELHCDITELQTGRKAKENDIMDGLSADAVTAIKRLIELDHLGDDRVQAARLLLGEPDLDL